MKTRWLLAVGMFVCSWSGDAMADPPLVDKSSSSMNSRISSEQMEALPGVDRYALDIAALVPSGDFGDVASTGVGLHLRGGERISNVFVIDGVGGWDKFGKTDATDQGFGETTINVFQFGPEVSVYPFRSGDIGGPIVRDMSFFFSPRLANFAGKQEYQTQQGTQEYRFHSTEFSLTGGVRYNAYTTRSSVLSVSVSHSHVFTEGGQARDGGEGYWRIGGSFTWVPPPIRIVTATQDGVVNFVRHEGRLTAEGSIGCGYPLEPLNGYAGPGLNFDATFLARLVNNTRAVGEVNYQGFSDVGPINSDVSLSTNMTQIEFGIRQDFPGLLHSFEPFVQGTISPAFLHGSYEIAGEKTEEDESGFFYNLTLGAARPLNDKTSVVTKFKYPLVDWSFDHEAPKAPTVSIGIRHDFQ